MSAEELCRLRGESGPLRKSHVIPEFCFRPLYDDKGRAIAVSREPSPLRYLQKGFRYPLLCDGCEQFLNEEYEKPFNRMWIDDPPVPPTVAPRESYTVRPDDAGTLRLFLLSVLWRAAVCPIPPFATVNVGDHEPVLREMVATHDSKTPWDYPIFAVIPLLPDSRRIAPLLISPYKQVLDGIDGYVFTFAGCLWHFMLSRGPKQLPFARWVLDDTGRMRIPTMDSWRIKPIRDLYSRYFANASRYGWVEPWNKPSRRKS